MYIFLSVTAAFFLLVAVLPTRQLKIVCAFYVLAIAIIAFHSVPVDRIWIDLKSYLADLSIYRPMGFGEFLDYLPTQDLPVLQVYLYFISKLGEDGFLMGFTITLVYSANFYILFDSAKRCQIGSGAIRFAIIFLVCTYPYYDAISWTKNPLAFALFGISLYGELVQGRPRLLCWAGYLLAAGIHTSITALIMLRLVTIVFNRYSQVIWKLFLLGISFFVEPLMNLLSRLFPDSSYFELVDTKVEGYFGAVEIKSYNRWGVCVAKYMVLCAAYFQYQWSVHKGTLEKKIPDKYMDFLAVFLLFLLGTIIRHDLFTRMTIMAGILFQPVLLCTLQQCEKKRAESRYIKARGTAWRGIVVCAVALESVLYLYFQYRGTLTLLEF